MSARGAIENTLSLYAWAYDLDRLELIGGCFTADVEVEFSTGLEVGRDAVVAELERRRSLYRPRGATPWHVISNVLVGSESATEATVVSFYTFSVKEPGEPAVIRGIGYYDDVFVEDGGVWRVRRRSVVAVGEAAPAAPGGG